MNRHFDPLNFLMGAVVAALVIIFGWLLINHQLDNDNRRHADQGRQMTACIQQVGSAQSKSDVELCRATVYGTR